MQAQNFKNHARYVPGFHLITFGVILAALVIAIILLVHAGVSHETVFYVLAGIALGLLFFYTRSFATGNHDRIIRAEENRSYRLTGGILDSRLSRSQIIALRFADDVEYADLSKRILAENLDAKAIKRSVQQWKADHHRV
ncbi:hypothetical protein BH10BAC3_BH10BAC3_13460 [soil metagenome]